MNSTCKTPRKTADVDTCSLVTLSCWLLSSGCHSPAPKMTKRTMGRKEKGELVTRSLVKDQIVSQENHRNETSPDSFLILYGRNPRKVANVWMPNTKYWSAFEQFCILFLDFCSTGITFMVLVEAQVDSQSLVRRLPWGSHAWAKRWNRCKERADYIGERGGLYFCCFLGWFSWTLERILTAYVVPMFAKCFVINPYMWTPRPQCSQGSLGKYV